MKEAVYWLTCLCHRALKVLLRHPVGAGRVKFVDVRPEDADEHGAVQIKGLTNTQFASDQRGIVPLSQLFPVENAVPKGSNAHLATSFQLSTKSQDAFAGQDSTPGLWRTFIESATIPDGYRNAGLKYAGYIASNRESWCLPSWIWTNAATVRYYCNTGELEKAVRLTDALVEQQQEGGGWIVRDDYGPNEVVPVLAPNDSAYIANNALLGVYRLTGQKKYLDAATKCADWICASARPDGLVWTGRNENTGQWLGKYTIVDTGFTAALFAVLYQSTGNEEYRRFLERFAERFIELFFDREVGLFATSVDLNGKRIGGHFARGQAWALEGLIPTYKALGSTAVRSVIESNVESLLRAQLANGGWAYNFSRAFFGEDCKGIPVIAKALMEWNALCPDIRLERSARRALKWCDNQTRHRGPATGGIFSFNLEGAVVHNLYTSTAFVYSSAYALETYQMVRDHE